MLKTCRRCYEYKPGSEFAKHTRSKDGRDCYCKPCKAIRAAEYYARNAAKVKAAATAYAAANRPQVLARKRAYRAAHASEISATRAKFVATNPAYRRAYTAAWYRANREMQLVYYREYQKRNRAACNAANRKYANRFPEKRRANWAKYRAALVRAIPTWADLKAVNQIYKACPESMEVDHMVPLNSARVCGLHCENNLQFLTPAANKKKSNKWWPDMWP